MARSISFTVCFFGLVSLAGRSLGQTQEFYPFRKYSQNEGLSSYNITKILKDRNGFVWIATQDGLNCFDGTKFLVFNKQRDPRQRINGNSVMDMTEDRPRGFIWLVTSYGGVDRLNTTTQAMDPLSGSDAANLQFKDKWLHAICVDKNVLWVGTYQGLYAYDLGTHAFLHLNNPYLDPKAMRVGKLLCDPAGRIWVCCDGQGVYLFDGQSGKPLNHLQAPMLNRFDSKKPLIFWNIAYSGKNDFALATNWGLRLLRGDTSLTVLPLSKENGSYRTEIFSCAFDNAANLWFSDAHGLYRSAHSGQQLVKISENTNAGDNWQSSIYSLYADDNHLIWIGSEEGLSYFSPTEHAFEKFYKSYTSTTKIQHAFSIFPANDSITYCGAANGLYRVNVRTYAIDKIDETGSCYLINRLTKEQLFVSNSQGSFILVQDRLFPVGAYYSELRTMQNDLLCCWNRFNDSMIVMGSELHKGLYVWNTRSRRIKLYTAANSDLLLDDGIINALYKDRGGNLWVLSVNALYRFDPLTGSAKGFYLKAPGTSTNGNILFDICETPGRYWVAAYGMGVFETDKDLKVKRIISEKDGLSNNGVYKIFSYGDSTVLVTSNNGLSVLDIPSGRIKHYFETDGLQSNSFEQFCGYNSHDTLFAGGVNGFTAIHPRYFSHNADPPKLYYTKVEMESRSGLSDTAGLTLGSLQIPSNVYQTTVFFTGINFSDPQRTTYAYKIKELKSDWISLGTQHSINLIGINPGNYTLQTRAANEDGVWDQQPAELNLIFLPKWYQTVWFKLGLLLAIACFFYILYRYRIAQFRKQQQIRREISNDLHDDLGSTLTTVRMLAQIAKRSPEKEEHLDQIEHSLALASVGLRDLIWVLDDARDSVRDFMERVRGFLYPITSAKGIRLEIALEEGIDVYPLSKAEKRNLLMIVKETVNNSVKYAECGSIRIRAKVMDKKCCISIDDDGKGFDAGAASDGNGLKNICYRARQIRYSVTISSHPGQGTSIVLTQGKA
jgi:signal transduction histidine kinase/ligand-binding sensor domain-containing protein